ncbi:MAG TPA: transporter [Vicinamibacterales bacterium]|nr:transporter [Vicinamibacterales bacterium]
MLGRTMLVIALIAATARAAAAQDPYNLSAPVPNLATIFTNIFGPNGLVVDSLATLPGEVSHSAHFNSDFQFNFGQFGTALVSQLVSVPLPSPGGGFTFEFDPSLGVFQRTTQSFGPILAERAETIGARRVSVGYAFQRFTFDSVEGISLSQVPAVFTHDNAQLLGGREDVVTTVNSITADVNQSTLFVTMGVSDKVDLSLAVPVIGVNLRVVSAAHIQRLGTTNPLTHFYRQEDGEVGTDRFFTAIGSAAGLGDLMIRMKANAFTRPKSGLAFGVDVRLPTGDEMNLLGSGTTGVQPFAIWSGTFKTVSPHVNAGYRWNGSSVLAGNPATGQSGDFPDQVGYSAGADVAVNPRLTVAFDVLGRYVIDAERLRSETFHALDGHSTFPNIVFARDSYNAVSGSIGLKGNLFGRFLMDVNVLFSLDNNGLRDKVTPLIGLEYSF